MIWWLYRIIWYRKQQQIRLHRLITQWQLFITSVFINFLLVATDRSGRLWQRMDWVNELNLPMVMRLDDDQFIRDFRLNKSTVERLLCDIAPYWPKQRLIGPKLIPMKRCVLMVLMRLSSLTKLRIIARQFDCTPSSVVKYTDIFIDCVFKALLPHHLHWPINRSERLSLAAGFYHAAEQYGVTPIPGVVGAVDCTHVRLAKVPFSYPDAYKNRKGWYSYNVLAVCDHRGHFIYVNVGWPGSVHDSRVYSSSDLRTLTNTFDGEFLIADEGFALLPHCLKGYNSADELTDHRYAFNQSIVYLRGCIERAFGRLKARFERLNGCDFVGELTTCRCIAVCFLLHNYCESHCDVMPLNQIDTAATESISQIALMDPPPGPPLKRAKRRRDEIVRLMFSKRR